MPEPLEYCLFRTGRSRLCLLHLLSLPKKVGGASRRSNNSVCAAQMQVSIAGQFGDLIESAFKRCAGVKDSSSLFGPHGGMLDRVSFCLFILEINNDESFVELQIYHSSK